MKTLSKSLLSIAILSSLSGLAMASDSPFSANVAMTTDYVWRGMSQTNEDPAIQGGFDFAHDSGFYAGTWGSNINFGGNASMELDLYAGYGGELASGLGYDLSYVRFLYPGEDTWDFGEVVMGLSYNIASFTYAYSPDVPDYDGDGKTDPSHYYELALEYELPQGFTLGGSVGWYNFPDRIQDKTDTNWSLSVGTSVGGFDLSLAYTDTDRDTPADNTDDGRAVFTISKSF